MKDEILVEEKIFKNRSKPLYVITSVHSKAINNMTRKKTIDEVDLTSLHSLGYAVALNKLDAYGRKTYIKHNLRTRKETRNYK